MILKLSLVLSIVICTTMCGRAMSNTMKRRTAFLQSIIQGLRVLSIHMTGMFENIRDSLIVSECFLLQRVGNGMEPGISANESWQKLRGKSDAGNRFIDFLRQEDIRILDRLFEQLGENGREMQKLLIEGTIQNLESVFQIAEKEMRDAEKLYTKIGFLLGLMVAIVFV